MHQGFLELNQCRQLAVQGILVLFGSRNDRDDFLLLLFRRSDEPAWVKVFIVELGDAGAFDIAGEIAPFQLVTEKIGEDNQSGRQWFYCCRLPKKK